MVTLTELQTKEMRTLYQDWPQKFIRKKLEASKIQVTEAGGILGQGLKSCLGQPLLVSEVQTFVDGHIN